MFKLRTEFAHELAWPVGRKDEGGGGELVVEAFNFLGLTEETHTAPFGARGIGAKASGPKSWGAYGGEADFTTACAARCLICIVIWSLSRASTQQLGKNRNIYKDHTLEEKKNVFGL